MISTPSVPRVLFWRAAEAIAISLGRAAEAPCQHAGFVLIRVLSSAVFRHWLHGDGSSVHGYVQHVGQPLAVSRALRAPLIQDGFRN